MLLATKLSLQLLPYLAFTSQVVIFLETWLLLKLENFLVVFPLLTELNPELAYAR